MTCIAVRGNTMAADTMAIIGTHVKISNSKKLIKRDGLLIGIAGDLCPDIKAIENWFFAEGGIKPWAKTKFNLLVSDGKSIRLWDNYADYEDIEQEFFAIGSGKEFAIGAMEAGASAIEAVAASIKWCPTVGGELDIISLED